MCSRCPKNSLHAATGPSDPRLGSPERWRGEDPAPTRRMLEEKSRPQTPFSEQTPPEAPQVGEGTSLQGVEHRVSQVIASRAKERERSSTKREKKHTKVLRIVNNKTSRMLGRFSCSAVEQRSGSKMPSALVAAFCRDCFFELAFPQASLRPPIWTVASNPSELRAIQN